MKININIRTKRKNAEKLKGYTYKISNIAADNCPSVVNIMLNSSLCITVLASKLSNLYKININKNFKNTRNNVYKLIAVSLQNCSYLSC